MSPRWLLPEEEPVAVIDAGNEGHHREIRVVATQDRELIQRWAQRLGAEPATGEASQSGPATVSVRDGDAGIRFNFPGLSRYRPIAWDEWFDNFSHHELLFLYERDEAGDRPTGRYRLIKLESLKKKAAEVIE
jgi:hypothetical protein